MGFRSFVKLNAQPIRLGVALLAMAIVAATLTVIVPKPEIAAKYLFQEVTWKPCSPEVFDVDNAVNLITTTAEVTCATVRVPANYKDPKSPDYRITLTRLHSKSNKQPIGSIFFNPGGPGGSGVNEILSTEFPQKLIDKYDLIGFDPRGVGGSQIFGAKPFGCSTLLKYKYLFGQAHDPKTQAEKVAQATAYNNYVSDCVKQNPWWWTLSTSNVINDIEVMRSALTQDQPLNFFGTSYGTIYASRYVSKFPEHVGKIVLDSPASVGENSTTDWVAEDKAIEARLNLYIAGYATYLHITKAAAWAKLQEANKLAYNGKLTGYAGLIKDHYEPDFKIWRMRSTQMLFLQGISALDYYPIKEAQAAFNEAMDYVLMFRANDKFEDEALTYSGIDLYNDNSDGVITESDLHSDSSTELLTITYVLDLNAPEKHLSAKAQKAQDDALTGITPKWDALYASNVDESDLPTYFKYATFLDEALNNAKIPDPPTKLKPITNNSGKQLLVIGGLRDTVTPYLFAKKTAKALHSPLITVDTDEHGSGIAFTHRCVNDVVIKYFTSDVEVKNLKCDLGD